MIKIWVKNSATIAMLFSLTACQTLGAGSAISGVGESVTEGISGGIPNPTLAEQNSQNVNFKSTVNGAKYTSINDGSDGDVQYFKADVEIQNVAEEKYKITVNGKEFSPENIQFGTFDQNPKVGEPQLLLASKHLPNSNNINSNKYSEIFFLVDAISDTSINVYWADFGVRTIKTPTSSNNLYKGSAFIAGVMSSDFELGANFSTQSISGKMTNFIDRDGQPSGDDIDAKNDVVNINNGRIGVDGFTADLVGNLSTFQITGSLDGHFYGAEAEEIAGLFSLDFKEAGETKTVSLGGFLASKQ